MNLKEQLAEKKAALKALEENIKAGEEEAITQGEEIADAIAEIEKSIESAERAQALLNQIGDAEETTEDETMEAQKARSLGEHFVNHVKNTQFGKRFDLSASNYVKASTDTQTSPAAAVDWATTFDRNVVTAARVPLVVRNLFGSETISGSTLQYLVEGAIEGAPAVTAEGAEKPQVHFANPTPKTVSLAKVACHIKESDEYINDYPFLASAINGRLLYELGLVEQNKLVTDLLATSGIQTGTIASGATQTTIAEAILKATADVQDQSGFAADAILIHPTDWYNLRIAKDGEDRYYGGGFFGAQDVPNLWGFPVCVSTATAAGTIVVGAFKTCGSVVQKGGVSVEAVNTNEDDFIHNLMTIRAEERLALAVRRPAGFKKLTIAS